jgi:hypothetical protein
MLLERETLLATAAIALIEPFEKLGGKDRAAPN